MRVFSSSLNRWIARTAMDSEYPVLFCSRYAQIVSEAGVLASKDKDFSEEWRAGELARALPESQELCTSAVRKGPSPPRSPWEEAVSDLCRSLHWKTAVMWREVDGRHINIYELRCWTKLCRRFASRVGSHHQRIVSVFDSRVANAVAQRGRSSSKQMLHEHRKN